MTALLVGVGGFFLYSYNSQSLNLVSDKLPSYTLIEQHSLEHSELYTYFFDNNYLKIEKSSNIDSHSAEVLIQAELTGIEMVYASAFSPYPGVISHSIVCDEKFQPVFFEKEVNGLNHKYYLLYSNGRFGLGVCSKDLIKYRHLIGWIYCPMARELYKIKYFVPLNRDFNYVEDFFLSLSCK